MTMDNITAKNYWQYRLIGWGLNGIAGVIAAINCHFTIVAYQDQGLPSPLPLVAALAYTLIQGGAMLFLLSPNSWGEFAEAFQGEARQAISPFKGTNRIVAAVLLSVIVVLLLSVTVGSIWADWLSTAQGLGLKISQAQNQAYIAVLAWVLVLGSEVCSLFAHQVLRLGKRHAIAQMAESAQLDPALTYSKEHLRAAKAAAKAQAKAAGQHWGQPHSS